MPEKESHAHFRIQETFSHGIIYTYSIPLLNRAGCLKIGRTTMYDTSQEDIEVAMHKRIQQQLFRYIRTC